MGLQGVIWGSMGCTGFYGVMCSYMGFYRVCGVLWGSMGLDGVIWGSMGCAGFYGGSMRFYGVLWGSIELCVVIWGSTGCMGFYEVLWGYV